MIFANGNTYTGSWDNDKRDGYGKMSFPNGAQSVGTFKENKKHGEFI